MYDYLLKHTLRKKHYYIYIVNNIRNKNNFINTLHRLQNNKLSKVYLCFDYEYNFKNIGLNQVMITSEELNNIYLFNHNYFDHDENNLIKNTLYLSNYKKILHGAESLDIPYIYNLLKNKDDIIKFTSTMYDTRIMCEYTKKPGQRCSLYEGLRISNTITEKQYDYLMKLYNRNPNLYKLHWNVYKMPRDAHLYAAYDVLFLKRFYKNMIKTPENLIINDITRLVLLERNNITNIINNNKNIINDKDIIKIKNSNLLGVKIDYFRNYISNIYAIYNKNKNIINDMKDLNLKNLSKYLTNIFS